MNATFVSVRRESPCVRSHCVLRHACCLAPAACAQGEEYVNSKTLTDVTFSVEGRPFYAHRIALLASSEAFRAMFGQEFREKDASVIDIPNIGYDTFTAMMRYIYVGNVEVQQDQALPLLQVRGCAVAVSAESPRWRQGGMMQFVVGPWGAVGYICQFARGWTGVAGSVLLCQMSMRCVLLVSTAVCVLAGKRPVPAGGAQAAV